MEEPEDRPPPPAHTAIPERSDRDHEPPSDHVYYEPEDYAGFLRRLGATAVDFAVMVVLWLSVMVVHVLTGQGDPRSGPLPARTWIPLVASAYLYLGVLRCSPLRTVGERLLGVRVVTLRGERPGLPLMTLRLLWWWHGTVNPFFDALYLTGDRHRQSLRDRILGTYVIKADAVPAGRGTRALGRMSFLGFLYVFPSVQPSAPSVAQGGERAAGSTTFALSNGPRVSSLR